MLRIIGATKRLHAGKGAYRGLGVIAHAALVVIDDMANAGDGFFDLEQLVDLLLIFDNRKINFGVFQHKRHVGGRRILIQRHGDATQGLGSRHGPIKTGPVVADYG